jgi:PPOX class probable F420-dependent enzyme
MMNSPPFDPAAEKYVSLATYRRNGVEVKTPVWIARVGERYYVFSAGDAGKVKRIRATPRVRLHDWPNPSTCLHRDRVG